MSASSALTIVGLGGSLRKGSTSRAALRLALEGAEEAGAATSLLDLRMLDLPLYDPDHDEPTDAAAQLLESCSSADGMVWSSPLYQLAGAGRVFDAEGRIQEHAVDAQLRMLGAEVVRVAGRFAADATLHRQTECDHAAERVATAA